MSALARRIGVAAGTLALVLGTAAPSSARTSPPELAVPTTMAATGDSITIAYDATKLLAAQPEYSWATGTSTSVNSLAQRLRATNPGLVTANFAAKGASMLTLATQAGKVAVGTDLVTVLMGANDACTSTVGTMTAVETFRTQARTALATLASRGVDQVLVASIPDIYRLWQVGSTSPTARLVWGLYRICPSMLANPTSTAQADVARRQAVRQRVIDFNTVLQQECSALAASDPVTACTFDGNAVFATQFDAVDISKVDYFHPSVTGQARLARVVWEAARFSATTLQPAA